MPMTSTTSGSHPASSPAPGYPPSNSKRGVETGSSGRGEDWIKIQTRSNINYSLFLNQPPNPFITSQQPEPTHTQPPTRSNSVYGQDSGVFVSPRASFSRAPKEEKKKKPFGGSSDSVDSSHARAVRASSSVESDLSRIEEEWEIVYPDATD